MLNRANRICFIFGFLFFAFLTHNISAQNKINPLPEGVSIHQLDNGIQLVLIEKPSLPMVGINTVVKVGSAYENFATSGMSHMLEHLLFNGTTTMIQKELYDATDRIGGYNNANTSEYYTNFMMVTPSENIVEGMKLQAAMLFDSVVPEEKFEKEKGIVLEEIAKSLAKSSEQIERNILSVLYNGHALSLPTLGTYETIKNMNRDEVYSFYKNYYVPNNMIISVIGGFNSTEMLKNAKDIYGKIKPAAVNEFRVTNFNTAFEELNLSDKTEKIYHRFYSGSNTQLQLFFELPNPTNLEYFEILNLILEDKTEEIKNELNQKYENSVEGIEFRTREYKINNKLQATVVLSSDKYIGEIKNALVIKLNGFNYQLSPETLEAEKIKALTSFLQNTEKPHMFGIYNADLFAQYGIEEILKSYSGTGFIDAAEEVKRMKLDQNPTVIIQHPNVENESSELIESQRASIFKGSNEKASIIVKQIKGSDLLAIHFLIKNKAAYEEKYGKEAAKILHETFGERMNQPEIQKQSAKYGFTFTVNDNPFIPMDDIYLSPEYGYIRAEGLANNLEAAINFLVSQLNSFVPTQEEFMKAHGKSQMPAKMGHANKAKEIFDGKVNEMLYEEEVYKENKDQLSYEKLIEFSDYYFNPSNMIVSVVSKETPEKVNAYFEKFSKPQLNGAINNDAFTKGFKEIKSGVNVEMKGGGEQSYLYYGFQKQIEEIDNASLKVLSLLLADKIVFDIREKQGMAYRMSAGIEIIKDKAMFNINLGTRPENIDKLIPQLSNLFSSSYLGEITELEISKSVNMYLGRMMFRRLSSINQAYYLGYSEFLYNDINYDFESLQDLKKVTVEDVKNVVKKYLKIENPVQIIVR